MHPILSFPWNPVVLVEGPIDSEALYHVASLAGFDSLRFLTLPGLDDSEKGAGKDSIILRARGVPAWWEGGHPAMGPDPSGPCLT